MVNYIYKPLCNPCQLFVLDKKSRISGFVILIALSLYALPIKAARLDLYKGFDSESFVKEREFDGNQIFNQIEENLENLEKSKKEGSSQQLAMKLAIRGMTNYHNGDNKQAIKDLSRAWEMIPNLGQAGAIITLIHLKEKEYDQAIVVAKRLQTTHPIGFTLAGAAYARKGEHDNAKLAFNKAIELRPQDKNAIFSLASYAIGEGDFEKARSLYNDLLNFDTGNLQVLLKLSDLEFKTGHPEQAVTILEEAMDKNPDSLHPRFLLAKYYLEAGNAQKTLAITEPALEQFSDNVALLELIGVARMKTGASEEAVVVLTEATQASPKTISPHYNLAKAYEQLNQYDRAIEEINLALKLDSGHTLSLFLYARLLAQNGQLDDAKNLLQKLTVSYPNSPDVKELEGKIALVQNRYIDAIALFQNALKGKESSFLTMQLAVALFKAGKNDAAYTTLRNWLDKYPKDILIRSTLANALLTHGLFNEAQQQTNKIIRMQPDNIVALNNLAWLLLRKGELEKALVHAEKAYNLNTNNPHVLDTLGVIFFRKGQIDKAAGLLRSAVEKSPDNLSMRFHLAEILTQSGNIDEAKLLLKDLLSQSRQFAEYQQANVLLKELETK